ncbi:MAG: 2-C-methyl-D-erythritol 4-phosphate cytidylyltransferase, partial [Parvibaculales bacterium]
MKTIALILAAGKGERSKQPLPKAYMPIEGIAMLRHSLLRLSKHPKINGICTMIAKGDEKYYEQASKNIEKCFPSAYGGLRRQQSAYSGLEAIAKYNPDYVLIHDAARPFFSNNMLDALLEKLKKEEAIIPLLPMTDSLKQMKNNQINSLPRQEYALVQTPQAFHFKSILTAYQNAQIEADDDSTIAEQADMRITSIAGEVKNRKLTYPQDFGEEMHYKTTSGFDAHPFSEGSKIILGGINIPHTHGIESHSDGDVLLHALTDALLGTIGAGDIGTHFPDSKPENKNRNSKDFVQHALRLVKEKGIEIIHVDCTIICQVPAISPHAQSI